ncbi:MAG: HU family DNA-binding protein [bacterium]|nr:HU family DNA-binding protein [bacterium]
MTKMDLIDAVASRSGLTKADASRAVEAMIDAISGALAKGEKVTVTGFGTFEVRQRAARMGRNPQTGAPLHIAATKTPAFKAGKGLKDAVR